MQFTGFHRNVLLTALVGGALSTVLTPTNSAAQLTNTSTQTIERLVIKAKDANALPNNPSAAQVQQEQNKLQQKIFRYAQQLSVVRPSAKGAFVLRFGADTNDAQRQQIIDQIRQNPDISWVEVDRRIQHYAAGPITGVLNTLTNNSRAWFLKSVASQPASSNTESIWQIFHGTSSSITAVLDTGVLADHASLQGHVLSGYDMVSDAFMGNDNQSNGTVGDRDLDPTDPGNWVTSTDVTNHPECGSTRNSSWHGTFVSALIAGNEVIASQNIAPVQWNGYILPVRVLGKCGGYSSDMADGIRWAAGLTVPNTPVNPTPAKVINLSLGATGACNNNLEGSAVADVAAVGAVVVSAAGNESGAINSPANCPQAIGVVGLDQQGLKASYSNLGATAALAAPGGDSAYPIWSAGNSGSTTASGNIYTSKIGTSFSAPLVSATVAIMKSLNPSLSVAQVKAILQQTARPFLSVSGNASCTSTSTSACNCNTSVCGAGMLDTAAAVAASATGSVLANVVGPTIVTPGQSATLDASKSYSASGQTLQYAWSITKNLPSSGTQQATLSSTTGASVTISIPNVTGAYRVQLTVSDSTGSHTVQKDVIGATATTASTSLLPNILAPLLGTSTSNESISAGASPSAGTATANDNTSTPTSASGGGGGGGGHLGWLGLSLLMVGMLGLQMSARPISRLFKR